VALYLTGPLDSQNLLWDFSFGLPLLFRCFV